MTRWHDDNYPDDLARVLEDYHAEAARGGGTRCADGELHIRKINDPLHCLRCEALLKPPNSTRSQK